MGSAAIGAELDAPYNQYTLKREAEATDMMFYYQKDREIQRNHPVHWSKKVEMCPYQYITAE